MLKGHILSFSVKKILTKSLLFHRKNFFLIFVYFGENDAYNKRYHTLEKLNAFWLVGALKRDKRFVRL